jgi:hypothetical protein
VLILISFLTLKGWTVAYFSSVSFIEEKLVDLSTSVFGEGTADKPGVAGSIKLLSGFLAGVLGCFLNTPFGEFCVPSISFLSFQPVLNTDSTFPLSHFNYITRYCTIFNPEVGIPV